MLIKKSTLLIELSQNKINLQRYATNLQGFQSRQEQIEQAVAGTIPLVQSLRAFRQKGIANFALTQKAEILLTFIANVEAEFKADPEWIIDNENFNKNNFESRVKDLQKALKEQLSEAWRRYRNQNRLSTNNELLNLLDKVSAFKPTVQRIRTHIPHPQLAHRQIEEIKVNHPKSSVSKNTQKSMQRDHHPVRNP